MRYDWVAKAPMLRAAEDTPAGGRSGADEDTAN